MLIISDEFRGKKNVTMSLDSDVVLYLSLGTQGKYEKSQAA